MEEDNRDYQGKTREQVRSTNTIVTWLFLTTAAIVAIYGTAFIIALLSK